MSANGQDPASAGVPGMLVVDAIGEVFSLLRQLALPIATWRIRHRTSLVDFTGIPVVALAAYDAPDWAAVADLAMRTRTVIVSTRPKDAEARQALVAGASGYLDARLAQPALARALTAAMNGELAYSRRVLAEHLRTMNGSMLRSPVASLTPRQRQVVALIAQGAADKEIARALGISTGTAQKHVTNLLKRLKVPNRAAAVAVAATQPGHPMKARVAELPGEP